MSQRRLTLARRVHPANVSQADWVGSGASAEGVQVYCNITRLHFPCLSTTLRTLVLPHAVSSLAILRDRGDGGDSQKNIQTIPPSTSATLMMTLTTHRSEDLMRDVHGERHDVAGAPPRGPRTALARESKKQTSLKVNFLNFHTKRVCVSAVLICSVTYFHI